MLNQYENSLSTIDITPLIRQGHDTSKGDFGTVGVIGGSNGMYGSLILSGRTAMLTGCGKVILGFNSEQHPLVDYAMPELMIGTIDIILNNINNYNVLIVGPGLGVAQQSVDLLSTIIDMKPTCSLIFDADALNIIATDKDLAEKFAGLEQKIITPHPKEASRLLNTTVEHIQADRINSALQLQRHCNSLVLLKGFGSIIVDTNNLVYINKTGSSALSNAGQGDSLCGIIASFIAQGMSLVNALRFAVYLHGVASDDLVQIYGGYNGIIATDTSINVRKIMNKILYDTDVKGGV